MFKTLVLSALLSVAVAAPHHSAGVWQVQSYAAAPSVPLVYQTSEYAQVGSVHELRPSAVSHQSRTDYHSKPVVKTVLAPVDIVQPVVHQAPVAVAEQVVVDDSAVVVETAPAIAPEVHIVADSPASVVVETSAVAQPEFAHVGSIVQQVPSAVSHQSRTDYHSKPVVKSIVAPFDYVQPIVHQAQALVYSAPAPAVRYLSAHPNALVYHHQQPAYVNAW